MSDIAGALFVSMAAASAAAAAIWWRGAADVRQARIATGVAAMAAGIALLLSTSFPQLP